MKKIYFILAIFFAFNAYPLAPVSGPSFGIVSTVKQYDPLDGLFSMMSREEGERSKKLAIYYSFYNEGRRLQNSCDYQGAANYSNMSLKSDALSSIGATLQYLGLDITVKAIAGYAKLLQIKEDEFKTLSENLVSNFCSDNITVYSKKLLKLSFEREFSKDRSNILPLVDVNYPVEIKELMNSKEVKTRELLYTIENFKSLCSWGGDSSDFRLMTSYLKDPFIFSFVINELSSKRISYDETLRTVVLQDKKDSSPVVCKNLICRKTLKEKFDKEFPHIIGATNLESELRTVYCQHFRFLSFKQQEDPVLSRWINNTDPTEALLQTSQFLSLITHEANFFLLHEKLGQVKKVMAKMIQDQGNQWAEARTKNLFYNLYYEEPLRAKLIPTPFIDVAVGKFSLNFDYTLGEFDQNLMKKNSLSMESNLVFPINYIRWLRSEIIYAKRKSLYAREDEILKKVTLNINHQLKAKEGFFLVKLWNEEMGEVIAREFISQVQDYRLTEYLSVSSKMINVPVTFRIGLFALKYQNSKFRSMFRERTLTFNQK